MNTYNILKLVHIIAVILFMGNIITGLFWMKRADKTGNITTISFTIKSIIATDRVFTIPGVMIILIGGFGAAINAGIPLLRTGWIFWPIVLFAMSGIAFMWKVAPLQQKINRLTDVRSPDQFNKTLYKSYLKQWEIWGGIALLTPFIAMAMMVMKVPVQSILK
jgi:uncharacterized membrane protein